MCQAYQIVTTIGSRAHAIGMRPHFSAEEELTCSIRRVLSQNSFMTKLMGIHMFATGNSYGERAPLARNYVIAKRVLDLLIAGTALVMFSPLLAFICIGIKLEGRSQAVLVRQRAVF